MHFFDRPTSPAKIRLHKGFVMLCWAAVAYFRIAGIEMQATGGPASAPRRAVRDEMSQRCWVD